MANQAKNPMTPAAADGKRRRSALEQLELDAQLVAFAMKHGRNAFMAAERRAEIASLIDSIGRVLVKRSWASLLMLGVTVQRRRGEIWLRCGQEELMVRAGVDGLIEVGDLAVRPEQLFHTEETYNLVQSRIIDWAVTIAGDERSLWSQTS